MAREGVGGERTEKATAKKRRDARENGQVRKSTELVTAVMMLALFWTLRAAAPGMARRITALMRLGLTGGFRMGEVLEAGEITRLLGYLLGQIALILLPMLAVAIVVAVTMNLVQIGFLFTTKVLKPKLSKMNPLRGIKRMFSLHTLYELAKAFVKVIIIGYIAFDKYTEAMVEFRRSLMQSPAEIAGILLTLITDMAFSVSIAFVILAVIDYFYQWRKYEKDLLMTKYEVKMEYRQQEGDPKVKSRIKQKQMQMSMMRMMSAVPDADVVITNPTHYAVALKYDEKVAAAPVVVAKGQDYVAQKIKEKAKEHGVEIVENKPVAQGLYAMCEIGAQVPYEMYQAVAEILAYVYRLKKGK